LLKTAEVEYIDLTCMILHLSVSVYLLVVRQRLYDNFVGKKSRGWIKLATFVVYTNSCYVTNMNCCWKCTNVVLLWERKLCSISSCL